MISIACSLCAAVGTFLLLTPHRRRGRPERTRSIGSIGSIGSWRRSAQATLLRAGLDGVTPGQFASAVASTSVIAFALAAVVFGSGVPAVLIAIAAAATPIGMWRRRRMATRRAAQEHWPRMIEELRVLTGAVGRPIPQALLEVGLRGPAELHGAFVAAQREWLLTTDFERMVTVLKARLGDPTADATCETLLVAQEVGGDLDRRLESLAEDRRIDIRDRKEAAAKQAGARFARWFVVIVPAGMALAGVSVGDGSASFRTGLAQALVAAAIALVLGCWVWAGRIMVVPDEDRVFDR